MSKKESKKIDKEISQDTDYEELIEGDKTRFDILNKIVALASEHFAITKKPKKERKPMSDEVKKMYQKHAEKAREARKKMNELRVKSGVEPAKKLPKKSFKSKTIEFREALEKYI